MKYNFSKNALSKAQFSRRHFLGVLTALEGEALLSKDSEACAFNEIEELPPGVIPSNKRELLYPTPEPSKTLFTEESGSFVASYPMLQNVTEDGASISWALNTPSTGWVEWGDTPSLGKIARKSDFGLNPYENDFLSARITGLNANTTYYYRTATCSFEYKTAYSKTISEPQYSDIYSFKTVGSNLANASFAVMNDTHNQVGVIREHCKRHEELDVDLVFWNGDLCHRYFFPLIAKTGIANPCDMPYATKRPLIFVPGNHEKRGPYAHQLKECLTPWPQSNPQFSSLGYNTAFRLGPIAIITLDTGENKLDADDNSGILDFTPYRQLQAAWLEEALSRPEIASAPYIVVFCHIPLCNTSQKDGKPTQPLNWQAFDTLNAPLWGPILDRSRVTLVISAHIHKFTYKAATQERPWAQITGGGPLLDNATCIHVEGNANNLTLTAESLLDKSTLGVWKFTPRT